MAAQAKTIQLQRLKREANASLDEPNEEDVQGSSGWDSPHQGARDGSEEPEDASKGSPVVSAVMSRVSSGTYASEQFRSERVQSPVLSNPKSRANDRQTSGPPEKNTQGATRKSHKRGSLPSAHVDRPSSSSQNEILFTDNGLGLSGFPEAAFVPDTTDLNGPVPVTPREGPGRKPGRKPNKAVQVKQPVAKQPSEPLTASIPGHIPDPENLQMGSDTDDRYEAWRFEYTPTSKDLYTDSAVKRLIGRLTTHYMKHRRQIEEDAEKSERIEACMEPEPASEPNLKRSAQPLNPNDSPMSPSIAPLPPVTAGLPSNSEPAAGRQRVSGHAFGRPRFLPVTMSEIPPALKLTIKAIPPSSINFAPSLNTNPFCPTFSNPASNSTTSSLPRLITHGVFSAQHISRGSFIASLKGSITLLSNYTRDVYNQYEKLGCNKPYVKFFKSTRLSHRSSGESSEEIEDGLVIDSRQYGNEMRFIRNGCHPNAFINLIITPHSSSKSDGELDGVQLANASDRLKALPIPADCDSTGEYNRSLRDTDGTCTIRNQLKLEGISDKSLHLPWDVSFGVFAAHDISRREEIILPWDWDDQHAIHLLPRLLLHSNFFEVQQQQRSPSLPLTRAQFLPWSTAELKLLSSKMASITLTLFGLTFCGCEKKRCCGVNLMWKIGCISAGQPMFPHRSYDQEDNPETLNEILPMSGLKAKRDTNQCLTFEEKFRVVLNSFLEQPNQSVSKVGRAATYNFNVSNVNRLKKHKVDLGPLLSLRQDWWLYSPEQQSDLESLNATVGPRKMMTLSQKKLKRARSRSTFSANTTGSNKVRRVSDPFETAQSVINQERELPQQAEGEVGAEKIINEADEEMMEAQVVIRRECEEDIAPAEKVQATTELNPARDSTPHSLEASAATEDLEAKEQDPEAALPETSNNPPSLTSVAADISGPVTCGLSANEVQPSGNASPSSQTHLEVSVPEPSEQPAAVPPEEPDLPNLTTPAISEEPAQDVVRSVEENQGTLTIHDEENMKLPLHGTDFNSSPDDHEAPAKPTAEIVPGCASLEDLAAEPKTISLSEPCEEQLKSTEAQLLESSLVSVSVPLKEDLPVANSQFHLEMDVNGPQENGTGSKGEKAEEDLETGGRDGVLKADHSHESCSEEVVMIEPGVPTEPNQVDDDHEPKIQVIEKPDLIKEVVLQPPDHHAFVSQTPDHHALVSQTPDQHALVLQPADQHAPSDSALIEDLENDALQEQEKPIFPSPVSKDPEDQVETPAEPTSDTTISDRGKFGFKHSSSSALQILESEEDQRNSRCESVDLVPRDADLPEESDPEPEESVLSERSEETDEELLDSDASTTILDSSDEEMLSSHTNRYLLNRKRNKGKRPPRPARLDLSSKNNRSLPTPTLERPVQPKSARQKNVGRGTGVGTRVHEKELVMKVDSPVQRSSSSEPEQEPGEATEGQKEMDEEEDDDDDGPRFSASVAKEAGITKVKMTIKSSSPSEIESQGNDAVAQPSPKVSSSPSSESPLRTPRSGPHILGNSTTELQESPVNVFSVLPAHSSPTAASRSPPAEQSKSEVLESNQRHDEDPTSRSPPAEQSKSVLESNQRHDEYSNSWSPPAEQSRSEVLKSNQKHDEDSSFLQRSPLPEPLDTKLKDEPADSHVKEIENVSDPVHSSESNEPKPHDASAELNLEKSPPSAAQQKPKRISLTVYRSRKVNDPVAVPPVVNPLMRFSSSAPKPQETERASKPRIPPPILPSLPPLLPSTSQPQPLQPLSPRKLELVSSILNSKKDEKVYSKKEDDSGNGSGDVGILKKEEVSGERPHSSPRSPNHTQPHVSTSLPTVKDSSATSASSDLQPDKSVVAVKGETEEPPNETDSQPSAKKENHLAEPLSSLQNGESAVTAGMEMPIQEKVTQNEESVPEQYLEDDIDGVAIECMSNPSECEVDDGIGHLEGSVPQQVEEEKQKSPKLHESRPTAFQDEPKKTQELIGDAKPNASAMLAGRPPQLELVISSNSALNSIGAWPEKKLSSENSLSVEPRIPPPATAPTHDSYLSPMVPSRSSSPSRSKSSEVEVREDRSPECSPERSRGDAGAKVQSNPIADPTSSAVAAPKARLSLAAYRKRQAAVRPAVSDEAPSTRQPSSSAAAGGAAGSSSCDSASGPANTPNVTDEKVVKIHDSVNATVDHHLTGNSNISKTKTQPEVFQSTTDQVSGRLQLLTGGQSINSATTSGLPRGGTDGDQNQSSSKGLIYFPPVSPSALTVEKSLQTPLSLSPRSPPPLESNPQVSEDATKKGENSSGTRRCRSRTPPEPYPASPLVSDGERPVETTSQPQQSADQKLPYGASAKNSQDQKSKPLEQHVASEDDPRSEKKVSSLPPSFVSIQATSRPASKSIRSESRSDSSRQPSPNNRTASYVLSASDSNPTSRSKLDAGGNQSRLGHAVNLPRSESFSHKSSSALPPQLSSQPSSSLSPPPRINHHSSTLSPSRVSSPALQKTPQMLVKSLGGLDRPGGPPSLRASQASQSSSSALSVPNSQTLRPQGSLSYPNPSIKSSPAPGPNHNRTSPVRVKTAGQAGNNILAVPSSSLQNPTSSREASPKLTNHYPLTHPYHRPPFRPGSRRSPSGYTSVDNRSPASSIVGTSGPGPPIGSRAAAASGERARYDGLPRPPVDVNSASYLDRSRPKDRGNGHYWPMGDRGRNER